MMFAPRTLTCMTARAISTSGASGGGERFLGDFAHAWREYHGAKRVMFGLASVFSGGPFSFAFPFITTFQPNISVRNLQAGATHSHNEG